ncbi:UDP-N-acetylglucosamine 2-epimerase [Fusobacterium varium]|uniref:UDP-N-acetylglucosamine 2-epimerase n=1 Tax=Fusobacterium varium TaxID=856 RepID=UPI0032BF8D21
MKKVLYVTGSRAEYGIMKRLLLKLNEDKDIELTIVATAMHTDKKYGETYKVIEEDGLKVNKLIDIEVDNSNNKKVIDSMAICLQKFGQYLFEKSFDAVMLLGDRYEILSVAIAAAMHNIPIIHLHGGEITLGNYDEFIRHSITKMSKLHLVSTEEYKRRVIQLGENPKFVHNIGSLGAENSFKLKLLDKKELIKRLNITDITEKEYFLIVFHPETVTGNDIEKQTRNLLEALDLFKKEYNFIFIGSNSDTGSDVIYRLFYDYTLENNYKFLTSVKPEEYLSLIKYSKGLIGNSSSGLIEVPSFGIPTLNIGDRQKGRVRGKSVIDVSIDKEEIKNGIVKMLDEKFRNIVKSEKNPYIQENSLEKAYQIIKNFLFSDEIKEIKEFFDINLKNFEEQIKC